MNERHESLPFPQPDPRPPTMAEAVKQGIVKVGKKNRNPLLNPDGIVNPFFRAQANDLIRSMEHGLPEGIITDMLNLNTPPALRGLPECGMRGKKSLGRVQQLINGRRFKARPAPRGVCFA